MTAMATKTRQAKLRILRQLIVVTRYFYCVKCLMHVFVNDISPLAQLSFVSLLDGGDRRRRAEGVNIELAFCCRRKSSKRLRFREEAV